MSNTDERTQVAIEHWGSPRYGGSAQQHGGMTFTAEVDDQRESSGKLLVSIGDGEDGDEERLAVAFEVSELQGSKAAVPTMMIYEGDEVVAKVIKQNNCHLIVPMMDGVQLLQTRLPNGEAGWLLIGP